MTIVFIRQAYIYLTVDQLKGITDTDTHHLQNAKSSSKADGTELQEVVRFDTCGEFFALIYDVNIYFYFLNFISAKRGSYTMADLRQIVRTRFLEKLTKFAMG